MTAIDRIRAADHLESTRPDDLHAAIIELADEVRKSAEAHRLLDADVRELARRVDKVEAALSHVPQARFKPDATESPPVPFRITGSG